MSSDQQTETVRLPIRLLLFFAGWSLLAVIFALQGYLTVALSGGDASFFRILIWDWPGWCIWGLLTPFIFRLAARFPLDRRQWLINLLRHILFSLPFAFAHLLIHVSIAWLLELSLYETNYGFENLLQANFFSRITWRILVYFILLIAGHAIAWYRQSSSLENQLARSQLNALKMQLQPHFLFNTLQSISELMHQNVAAADEMTVRLADFLRLTLENRDSQEITLDQEMEFVRAYLDIQKVRFGDRLTVDYEISPEIRMALVPNLILQPLVENAVRYGIDPLSSAGTITVKACGKNGRLILRIIDNGEGLPSETMEEGHFRSGFGLSNVRSRLKQLYGPHFSMTLRNAPEGGTIVTVEIPYRSA